MCGAKSLVHTMSSDYCKNCDYEALLYCPTDEDDEQLKDQITCKYCGAELEKNDRFCLMCGKAVNTEIESETDNTQEKDNEIFCMYCGAKLNVGDKFCLMCGKKVDIEESDNKIPNTVVDKEDSNQDEAIDEIIGDRYKLIRQTGKGASSVVYLAQDIRLERVCAVKVIKKDTYANKIASQESLDEANKMKLLAHISIPQLYDIFDDEDKLCIVMEFIEGRNLSEIIKSLKQPLDEFTVINWAKQLCRVLFYLHTLKPPRIFRDLKPANIILQPNGVIKLIDFGTMKNYDESRAEDTVNLGTKGYAAPEQFGGRGQTDARTDIYGLGMTLYHLITGVNPSLPPFEVKPIRYYRKDISNGLEKIVMKCIEVERENRYQSAIEMINDLEKL
jgi:tRNA A-37 threonylcarbamoyl transferase component Bud32/DNA-directed RNA polymerase subunit RPC12/RpoP